MLMSFGLYPKSNIEFLKNFHHGNNMGSLRFYHSGSAVKIDTVKSIGKTGVRGLVTCGISTD